MSGLNNQTFNSTILAATAIAEPFTSPTPGTVNQYSYKLYSKADMQTALGINDLVWLYGGPIVGYNNVYNNFVATTDCSGFAARVLNAVSTGEESLYANIVINVGAVTDYASSSHPQPFPSASDYAAMFMELEQQSLSRYNYWRAITFREDGRYFGSFGQVQPGDVLAYSLPPGNTDTGHVMIVSSVQPLVHGQRSTAWPTDLTEFTGDYVYYAVTVYDSSNVQHHNDTRTNGATGVGRGTVLVVTDSNNKPIAFQFAGGDMLLYVNIARVPMQTTLAHQAPIQALAVGRGTPSL